ncbi:lipid-A-disaccharide synthase [Cylindrospermopsis raciborskii]|uniref:lipid-A-disaccharide synthase n=1 Tax=Cylindrospermopsis raciborskii TaxID=77022 RepID=UPI00077898C0|nr:lipid-A-disaccharide synthase [Cylindrospermopsis raciborskii]
MRVFISTGEVSGDLQGAMLITALKNQAATLGLPLEIVALGGSQMAKAGARVLGDTSGIGSMGIVEALPYIIPTIMVQRQAIAYLKKNPPDIIVLIDYMTPNMGIGSYMQQHFPQVPIVYYIAPQEWVWSMSLDRTRRIVNFTDKLLAIFPEEARYYQAKGANVNWVGHPLVDKMVNTPSRESARKILGIQEQELAIALLPASRHQELKYLLPGIFQAAKNIQSQLPKANFLIPLSLERFRGKVTRAIKDYGLKARIFSVNQQEIFAAADLAITKSGTANLELALANVPQVVVYSLSPFTAWVGRKILKGSIPFASPVNLVLMREIVPELLQEKATADNITKAAMELLLNREKRQKTLLDYQEMRQCLGEVGVCDRAAKEILAMGQFD